MSYPYVATPQGFARKIGPKSKYGMNDDSPAYGNGIGPQGAQSSMNSRQKVGSSPQKVGTPHPEQEGYASWAMRQAREQAAANAALEKSKAENGPITESEKKGLIDRIDKALEKARAARAALSKPAETEDSSSGDKDSGLSGVARRMNKATRRFNKVPKYADGKMTL